MANTKKVVKVLISQLPLADQSTVVIFYQIGISDVEII